MMQKHSFRSVSSVVVCALAGAWSCACSSSSSGHDAPSGGAAGFAVAEAGSGSAGSANGGAFGDDNVSGSSGTAAHGGAGHAGTGSGGSAGTSGNGGAGAANDLCPWGDQQERSTSYGLATTLRVCYVGPAQSQVGGRYRVTTPPAAAAPGGGYVIVNIRKVLAKVAVDLSIDPVAEDFPLDLDVFGNGEGADLDAWFGATPGAEFDLEVIADGVYGVFKPFATFELSATFVPVHDQWEPNNYQGMDTPITLGTTVTAFDFYGYGTGTTDYLNGWGDFYKITVPAGTPTIVLGNVLKAFPLDFSLGPMFGGEDFPPTFANTFDQEGTVTIKPKAPLKAGTYEIWVQAQTIPHPYGKGTVPAAYATQPYTLSVTE